jgi:6-methylsalicylate decarboxylase
MSAKKLSRRQWLTGITAVAAGASVPIEDVIAQSRTAPPHRIDVHHHYSGDWNVARTLEGMDQNKIAVAVLSRPGIPVSEPEKARKQARETNERGAQLVHDHPTRFGLFATVPIFDVEGSLREVAYAYDALKADGVCLVTSYSYPGGGTKWVGDPVFSPVFAELNRRKAVVFIHPTTPPYFNEDFRLVAASKRGESGVNETALENQFDTPRGVVSLIINGTIMRSPDIRFVFCHGGGGLLPLHERLNHLLGEDRTGRTDGSYHSEYIPNGFDNELRKLHFDVVRVANPANLALMTALLPAEHILFGSDYPPVPISETANQMASLRLDAKVIRPIERDNALALFPRLRA